MCKQILPISTIRNIWRTVWRRCVLILGLKGLEYRRTNDVMSRIVLPTQIITTEVFESTANFVRDNRDQKQCIKQIHFIWPCVSTLITGR